MRHVVKETRRRKIKDDRTLTECEVELLFAIIKQAYRDKNRAFFKKSKIAKLLNIDYNWVCEQMGAEAI